MAETTTILCLLSPADHLGSGGASCILGSTGSVWEWPDCTPSGPFLCQLPALLQGILPTQESNQGLLHCRQILYQLSYQGSPTESMVPSKPGGVRQCLNYWVIQLLRTVDRCLANILIPLFFANRILVFSAQIYTDFLRLLCSYRRQCKSLLIVR